MWSIGKIMARKDMVKCVGRTEDVFFDSVDHLSAEHSAVDDVSGCEFFRNEMRSVKERRDVFLREMGFVEAGALPDSDDACSTEIMLDRVVQSSEVVLNSSSSSSLVREEENLVFGSRECSGNFSLADVYETEQLVRDRVAASEDDAEQASSSGRVGRGGGFLNKRIGHWWTQVVSKRKGMIGRCRCEAGEVETKKFDVSRVKVQVSKKKIQELSALFEAQEIQAHKGIIWTMKFSPDCQFLASGGEDGVVRVWAVKSLECNYERFPNESDSMKNHKARFGRDKKLKVPVVFPNKMFHIEQQPVQEFHGHTGDVLDLAWSSSNYLLSSSTDKTVRLWQVGSDTCLSTFHHTDYVTCVQFNPKDDQYFISGSIDGKVRVWGVSKRRVLDWADVRDAVTAVCYQPDGQGFVVGSLSGACRFYETKGDLAELIALIHTDSSKKSFTNKITGIQFCTDNSHRVMVMSEDSKLRILDKGDLVCKYRGLPKSGSQMSASFTPNGKRIISLGEDSCVYMWNHEEPNLSSTRHKSSIRSCERFYSEGLTVAAPWYGTETRPMLSASRNTEHEAASMTRDPFITSNSFLSKASAIWPEEIIPSLPQAPNEAPLSSTWGLVIVTANCDGMIRTFHNYGQPINV